MADTAFVPLANSDSIDHLVVGDLPCAREGHFLAQQEEDTQSKAHFFTE
jgi:hypothetical protein